MVWPFGSYKKKSEKKPTWGEEAAKGLHAYKRSKQRTADALKAFEEENKPKKKKPKKKKKGSSSRY